MEKKLQKQLEADANELRAKLQVAEEKLAEQKQKVSSIFPTVAEKHKTILASRDKYLKLSKCCRRVGQLVSGVDYQ